MDAAGFSLENYDSIGFDLDCTIAEYNVRNLHKLVHDLLLKYLVEEKNYPRELLLLPFEEMEHFLQKGLFMDFKRGNVLKVNERGEIVMATHGTTVLTEEQIVHCYGPGRTLDAFGDFIGDPMSVVNTPHQKVVRPTLDCFDLSCILLFARIVDFQDKNAGGASEEYTIWPDLLSGLYQLYGRNHFADGKSEFFAELRNKPWLYYKKWPPEKLNWLKELKSRKKFLFLLTGSFIDFAASTASYCLGENWKDHFDLIICYARKPFFFSDNLPYLRVENDTEKEPVKGEDLHANTVYSQGNWQDLKSLISRRTGVDNPRCLYMGDNLIQDVYAPVHFGCCDSVAVSLELKEEFRRAVPWGSYFEDGKGEISCWNKLIRGHAKICVSDLDVFVGRRMDFEYECLKAGGSNEVGPQNGYYIS